MKELLSPKQVATSIGVSESSLKRWCDAGRLQTERTPGGHRRIRIGEVIRFLRDGEHRLVRPEVLGLPTGTGQGPRSIGKANEALLDALKQGDGEQSRRLVMDLYLSGNSVVRICEELLAPTLHAIGDGWQCGAIEIYQEHRACEILNQVLYDLRMMLPPPDTSAPVALGGSTSGDNYRLASLMVELVLVSNGWSAASLGSSLPFSTLIAAAQEHKPGLFWLSFSHVTDPERVEKDFEHFLESTPESMRVITGGQQTPAGVLEKADNKRVWHCPDLIELRNALDQASTLAF